MSNERWNRLEYIIEDAVPDEIPGWRFRYSQRIAEAVEQAGYRRSEGPSIAQVDAFVAAINSNGFVLDRGAVRAGLLAAENAR